MQARVDRLREIFNLVQPVIPKKTVLPVLKNVLLKDGQAIATDLETMIVLDFPEAEGEYLLPHHSVKELLRYVPGDDLLTIEQPKDTVKLSWDGGKASYISSKPLDYPPVPEVKEGVRGSIDGDMLVSAIKSVAGYCSDDSTRPVLNGVSLSLNKTIELAAGDGYWMAYKILPIAFPGEGKVVIPSHSAKVLSGLWVKIPPNVPLEDSIVSQVMSKRQIELALGEGKVAGKGMMARFGRATVFIKPIEGSAPNFSQLIPKEPPLKLRVFAPEFDRAVRRCAEVARVDKGLIRLSWTEDILTVSAASEDSGSVEASIKVQTEGGAGKVAVNVDYLLRYLVDKDGLLSIGVTDAGSPVLFRYSSAPLVVIMPMFAKS